MSLTYPIASEIIDACDAALEDANEHSTSAVAIWDAVSDFIPREERKAAARSLADSLAPCWEDYLPNVTS